MAILVASFILLGHSLRLKEFVVSIDSYKTYLMIILNCLELDVQNQLALGNQKSHSLASRATLDIILVPRNMW